MSKEIGLSEFVNMTKADVVGGIGGTWCVLIPIHDGTVGSVHVTNAKSEYDAKEQAYNYLQSFFENKN